jgi:hypothetical protein
LPDKLAVKKIMSGKKSFRPHPAIGIRRTVSVQIICAIGRRKRRKNILFKKKKSNAKKEKDTPQQPARRANFFCKKISGINTKPTHKKPLFIPFPFCKNIAATLPEILSFFPFFLLKINFTVMKNANHFFGSGSGSENFYRHSPSSILYMDGVKELAEKCGAYWLIDLIISHQCYKNVNREPFQVWD